jgi:hypothetical protein
VHVYTNRNLLLRLHTPANQCGTGRFTYSPSFHTSSVTVRTFDKLGFSFKMPFPDILKLSEQFRTFRNCPDSLHIFQNVRKVSIQKLKHSCTHSTPMSHVLVTMMIQNVVFFARQHLEFRNLQGILFLNRMCRPWPFCAPCRAKPVTCKLVALF